jgi:hypothetical protein
MPALAPEGLKIAVFTPIRRPALSSRGPPELPGLIAASVWTSPSIASPASPPGSSRSRAETMPVVSVQSRPKGLPMAKTFWPTRRSALLPTGSGGGGRPAPTPIRSTARSCAGLAPTSAAAKARPSASRTVAPEAPARTWWLVTTWPASSQTKPEPVPRGTLSALRAQGANTRSVVAM